MTLGTLATISLIACGQAPNATSTNVDPASASGIVNGTAVEESDVVSRSTAALYIKFPQGDRVAQFCTATLVGARVLTTAGHCLLAVSQSTGLDVKDLVPHLRVAFGLKRASISTDENVKFISLKEAVVHPDFRLDALVGANEQTPIPDVAILQLAEDAPAGYEPAELLRDEALLQEGTSLILAGYGLTQAPPTAKQADELRRINVKVLKAKYNPAQFSYEVAEGRSACSGDSGGPAYLSDSAGTGRLILAGVTSFGDRQCSNLGVYTSVPAMINWIDEQIKSFDAAPVQSEPAMVAEALL